MTTMSSICPAGVKTLDMSFNAVSGIMSDTFSRVSALVTLDLQANNIDLVQEGAFSGNKLGQQCQTMSMVTVVRSPKCSSKYICS